MNIHVSVETIKKRYSCRSYTGEPLMPADREALENIIRCSAPGPFGNKPSFTLLSAEPDDSGSLKGLGTYGFIRKPAAFIVGSADEAPMYLEDFGYCTEKIILETTAAGLGTCWLGGTFKRSRFAEKSGIRGNTEIPAVIATGYIADKKTLTEKLVRAGAGSDRRKDADEIFFSHELEKLDASFYSSPYGSALAMVRIAPSASNKQPWRIVRDFSGKDFHFFMERTKGYNDNRFIKSDLQRVDMGIAMCHFSLVSEEYGLRGTWEKFSAADVKAPPAWEYIASWRGK